MMSEPLSDAAAEARAKEAIAARPDVSRETFEMLERYVALLRKWNRKINLVSRSDESVIWSRHLLDSLALAEYLPESGLWTDLGSGGGLPAVPLAIIARTSGKNVAFRLIESDRRKCAFLTETAAQLGLNLKAMPVRIEQIQPEGEKFVSARALASVAKLLDLLRSYQNSGIPLLLLKGDALHQELTEAARHWHMQYQSRRSTTTSRGYICLMQGYRHVAATGSGEP